MRVRSVGLFAGPALFLALLATPAPAGMSAPAHRVAALAGWMAVWWLSTAVPLEVTALLPLAVLPLLSAGTIEQAATPYANSVIFLFLGGFFIAAAMERWHLHKRIAFAILRMVGTDARRVVLAFMLATAFLSMWISNTAAAVMMLPMAMAVQKLARADGTHGGTGAQAHRRTEKTPGTATWLGWARPWPWASPTRPPSAASRRWSGRRRTPSSPPRPNSSTTPTSGSPTGWPSALLSQP